MITSVVLGGDAGVIVFGVSRTLVAQSRGCDAPALPPPMITIGFVLTRQPGRMVGRLGQDLAELAARGDAELCEDIA